MLLSETCSGHCSKRLMLLNQTFHWRVGDKNNGDDVRLSAAKHVFYYMLYLIRDQDSRTRTFNLQLYFHSLKSASLFGHLVFRHLIALIWWQFRAYA